MESINTSNTTNHSNQCIEQKNAWSLSIHLTQQIPKVQYSRDEQIKIGSSTEAEAYV